MIRKIIITTILVLGLYGCGYTDPIWEVEFEDGTKVYTRTDEELVLSFDGRVLLNRAYVPLSGSKKAVVLRKVSTPYNTQP